MRPSAIRPFPELWIPFFQKECPQLGGQRTGQVLVQFITQMIERFYPETSRLPQGQIQWTTVHKDEQASYDKKITTSRLTSVILDLIQAGDAMDRAEKLRDIKQEAVARLYQQAYEQNGCMTHAEQANPANTLTRLRRHLHAGMGS